VDGDEEGTTTAAREVEEETGWQPGPVTHLLSFQPMIGMVDTPHELYFAHAAEWIGVRLIWKKPAASTGFRSGPSWT
jgi:8-oxo-dGTP pyrophosphatase MutT (NUDIX family)